MRVFFRALRLYPIFAEEKNSKKLSRPTQLIGIPGSPRMSVKEMTNTAIAGTSENSPSTTIPKPNVSPSVERRPNGYVFIVSVERFGRVPPVLPAGLESCGPCFLGGLRGLRCVVGTDRSQSRVVEP